MGNLKIKQKLTVLIQRGLKFELSQDKLLIKGDLSILSEDDKYFLKSNKEAIISLIEEQTKEVLKIQKINTDIPKPLTFSQQSLWLLDKINNGSSHYNLTSAFQLKGDLDYKALDQTFLTILQRHESLRNCFSVNKAGEPVQEVQTVSEFNIVVEELKISIKNKESLISQKVKEEANKIFDLTKDLLLNVRLLKISKEEHVLIVTMHHIASDGWSMGILVNEFSALYASFVKGASSPLSELNLQYSDYAHWQRNWFKGRVLEEHTDYWKNQLSELPVLHNLPLDKPRPIVQSFNGNVHNSLVEKNTLEFLYDLCHSESASLFMGVQAAFSTLLSRYSNEKDIVVGSPIANREKREIADLVGFFMNLLVLRSDFSKNPSFRQTLRQSKKMLEEAYQYQQMPFEKLVEELDVNRNLSHTPLFQVLLTLQNNQEGEFAISNLEMTAVVFETKSAKYDLSLNVSEDLEGLHLSWEYNTDLFDESTIIGMAEHFNTLLKYMLDNPDENVFNANIIGEKEAKDICKHLKGETLKLKASEQTIKLFDKQIKKQADCIAVISNDVSYSYKQLGEKVDSIAHYLLAQGVQNNDKVGICLLRNIDLVATIFACLKIGAAYIPLDPVYPPERLSQIVNDAKPKCIVTYQSLKKLYLDNLPTESIVSLDKVEIEKVDKVKASKYNDESIAYIIFTSGTTGKPKGIEITHGNLDNLLKGFDVSFGDTEKQTWLAQTSMNFDISVLELIWTISRGKTMVLQQSSPFKLLAPERLSPAKKLDFSVMFFGADKSKEQKYDLYLETAKFADKNDFTSIWTPERHFGEFGGAFPSPSVLSSALAAITEKIGIRSGSVVLPLHDPIRVAEEWSLIDNLSKGRVGMSIASGWQPDDFVFYKAYFKNRHKEMKAKIEDLKNLWNGNPLVRKNGLDNDFEIKIRPKPIQEELPLWITAAGSPATFEYAGEIGANLLTHMLGQSLEKLAENISIYHKSLVKNGYNVNEKKVTLMLHTYIDSSKEKASSISEKPFKDYLKSSAKLMEPLAKEVGIDINADLDELIDLAYKKFSEENTLIGSPESCQEMLFKIQSIGVSEVACLVDFGVESDKVLAGLDKIVEAKDLYNSYGEFLELLNIDNQKTELDLIDDYNITHVQMTPSQSKLVLDLHNQTERSLSSVKHWFIGGEALNEDLIRGLSSITDSKLYNMYGPTETTVWSAWREINKDDIHIGEPIINTDLLLLNEFEQQVPIGVVGELYIGGLGLAKRYYNNYALTNERFKNINNPIFGNKRFYKTGDLMKLKPNGNFEYVGRKDSQVKVNGYRVELEEIEKTLAKVSGVKDCKVVPTLKNNNTSLSAYVVKDEIVYGDYKPLPLEQQAKAFSFPDGSTVYHQSNRQLALAYQEVIEDAIYFKHNISIPENGLVLDLGANIGTFSIDVNRRQPSATVIAFEPIPQIFSALKKNFEHRQIKGRVLNYGVSNKKAKATFYYYPEMAGMSGMFADQETIVGAVGQYMTYDQKMLKENGKSNYGKDQHVAESFYDNINESGEFNEYLSGLYKAEEVECQLTTVSAIIDELNIETIDLLKLDVEKSECLVLEGIREEHWPMIRQLAVEVDGDTHLKIISELLLGKGYKVNVDDLVLSDGDMPNDDNTYMLYAINPNHGLRQNGAVTDQFQAQVSERSIRDYLRQMLPDYMAPTNIAFVPSIPLMGNGKVDMVKLQEIKPQNEVVKDIPKLTNKTELAIYTLWCEVLEKENVPHHVSIFEAGGNSMKIVLLHEKLQTAFNVKFSLVELFRNPTIPQQAKLVQDANNKGSGESIKKALDKGKSRRQARARRVK